MKRSRRVRSRLIAACAAVMILGVSMTAVAAFDFNEIFQGFFKKETIVEKEGKSEVSEVPLEAGDDFLASAGNVIQEETVGNGLKLTLRGTVGDGNALYAALDVETEDGSPFSVEQENSVQSYRFEEVMLEGEGIGGDELNRIYCACKKIVSRLQRYSRRFISFLLYGHFSFKKVLENIIQIKSRRRCHRYTKNHHRRTSRNQSGPHTSGSLHLFSSSIIHFHILLLQNCLKQRVVQLLGRLDP